MPMAALLSLVIAILIAGLVFWLLLWMIDAIGLPEPFCKVAKAIVCIAAVIFIISRLSDIPIR